MSRIQRLASLVCLRMASLWTRAALKIGGGTWFQGMEGILGPGSASLDRVREASLRAFQRKVLDVPGLLSEAEKEFLLFAAVAGPGEGDVIEIGSWLGKSTLHLAMGCRLSGRGKVHAVDTFQEVLGQGVLSRPVKGQAIHAAFRENIRRAGLAEYVTDYPMESARARDVVTAPARLLFIDACHEYEAVKADMAAWKDRLVPGGLLLFHDFRVEAPGTMRAIREDALDNREYRLLLQVDSLMVFRKA